MASFSGSPRVFLIPFAPRVPIKPAHTLRPRVVSDFAYGDVETRTFFHVEEAHDLDKGVEDAG